eukprot:COSAG06_NODE_55906_length_287_cov_0.829787_1_plen_49_part_01
MIRKEHKKLSPIEVPPDFVAARLEAPYDTLNRRLMIPLIRHHQPATIII